MVSTASLEEYAGEMRALQERQRPEGIPGETIYPLGQVTVPAHVSHWARQRPDQRALVIGDEQYTYADLDIAHRRLAGWFIAQGVAPGDRVAVYLGNSSEFAIAFLAILRIGAVHVPVNPMFGPAELGYELSDADVSLVITKTALTHNIAACGQPISDLPVLVTDGSGDGSFEDAMTADPMSADLGDVDSLAALNYTGGTTGLPKGCQHTQRHMLYTAASAGTATNLAADGSLVTLCYIPIFWIAGEDLGLLLPFVYGGTSVLMSRWDAQQAADAIEQQRVTLMIGTVENYLELMDLDDISERDFSSLTDPQAMSFVRKMTPEVRSAWSAVAPGSTLREAAYGMTETHTIDCIPFGYHENDFDLRSEPVFCGIPAPGTDIAVVEYGTQKPLPLGEAGEIIVRSPSVTTGYWRNPDATAEQLVDGWIHTGDDGRIDEHGFLHFLGRNKEMIKVKGMSVFPADVEMLLAQHEAVESVAVVPRDDPDTGQVPVAFVVLRPGEQLSIDELTSWSQENMAAYKIPLISIVDALPMTDTGKVRKHVLEDQADAVQTS